MNRRKVSIRPSIGSSIRERLTSALSPWTDHPVFDFLIVLLAVGAHLFIVKYWHSGDFLAWTTQDSRKDLYVGGSALMGLIAGFAGTAIAQYGSSSGPIVIALRSAHGKKIRKNWLNIAGWLLVGALVCLAALVADRPDSPNGSQWLFEFAMAIAITKFARLLFLFSLILSSADAEVEEAPAKKTARLTIPDAQ
ncbi:hypothetical protein AB0C07_09775 [Actinoplanes missouriensis]|uniref:hypothetical protein n=1 Tax=Actinoplanes missouriensis TaxID=1866 RepID=UPI0033C486A5